MQSRQRPPTGAPVPPPRPRSATDATPVAAHSSPALGRRRPWWWIVAPVVVLTAAATSLLHWCGRSEPPPPPPPVVAVAPPVDATPAPELPVVPVDASAPAPAWLPKPDAGAAATLPRPKPRLPAVGSPAAPPPPIAPAPRVVPPDAGVASVDPNPPQRGKPARVSLKCKAMAKLEHGPALSVVKCLCEVNNPARAKVVFTRLSGAEREQARVSCAQRGIALP
jgi:hypothetical protein